MPSARTSGQNIAISRLPGLLRKAATNPKPDVVHKLRTTVRRAETALLGSESSDFPHLSKQLKRVRKRAGAVRDIDVQNALLESLNRRHDKDAMAVATALQTTREKQERKIKKLVSKELEDGIVKRLRKVAGERSVARAAAQVDLAAVGREFLDSLRQGMLTEENLHEFRTTTKKLKYRAELASESDQRDELIAALKSVQDAIGSWHDGVMLSETAKDVLGNSKRNSLVSLLGTKNQSRFLEALRAVERGREAIGRMFVEPVRKKPAGSEQPLQKQEAASA